MKKEEENKKKETKKTNKTQTNKKTQTTKAKEIKTDKKPQTKKSKTTNAEATTANKKNQTKKTDKTKTKNKAKTTEKEKKSNKFINIVKKKWLIQGTTTLLLVLAIITGFIAISMALHSLDLTPIDLSQEKLFTLTEESKNKVKEINEDVHIYFIDASDDDENYELAKQFHNANEHITIEKINSKERTDLTAKYEIEAASASGQIVVESNKRYKKLTAYDLITSDLMGQTSSIADKKLTNTILYVVAEEIPHAYILDGFSDFSSDRMSSFIALAKDSSVEIESLNIITTGSVPENCSTLIITTPSKDFDAQTTQAIMDYIQKGGNILWLNSLIAEKVDMPNVNKILAEYAIEPFEIGSIFETDANKMASGQPYVILPDVQGTEIATGLTGAGKAILLLNPTKINKASDEVVKEKNVTISTILQASENSYFRTNIANTNTSTIASNDTKGPFDLGVLAEKTLKEENKDEGTPALTSQMVVIGENYFASDLAMSPQQPIPFIYFANNADLAVNAISTLVDKEETIAPEKSTGTVSYSPTQQQNIVIIIIISAVPVLILLMGVVVWVIRRRKK